MDSTGWVDGVSDLPSQNISNVSWFPNPFREKSVLQIKNFKSKNYELTIYSSTNQVFKTAITSERSEFYRNSLASGIYFYMVTLDGEEIGKGKLVIQ